MYFSNPSHQDIGYQTHGFGKWNIGHCNVDYLPTSRGFNSFLGYMGAGIDYVTFSAETYGAPGQDMLDMTNNGEYFTVTPAGVDSEVMFMDAAMSKIQTNNDLSSPIFMWMALHGAHDDEFNSADIFPVEQYLENFDLVGSDYESYFGQLFNSSSYQNAMNARQQFMKVVLGIDAVVEQLKLSFDKLRDTTDREYLLIVNSDNGGDPCAGNLIGHPYPDRGSKFNYFEGGVKVPAFIYSSSTALIQDSVVGTEYPGLMHHVDWVATLLSAAGALDSLSNPETYDSVDRWGELSGRSAVDRFENRTLFLVLGKNQEIMYFVMRKGKYKVFYNVVKSPYFSDTFESHTHDALCETGNLSRLVYDIAEDPHESNDLSKTAHGIEIFDHSYVEAKKVYKAQYVFSGITETDDAAATDASYFYDNYIVPWNCPTI